MVGIIFRSLLVLILFNALAIAQYSTPVRDVENPARTPLQDYGNATFPMNFINTQISLASLPSGQRLVIEYVSVRCETDADDNISRVSIGVYKKTGGGGWAQYYFPITVQKQGNTYDGKASWVAAQSMRLYSDSVLAGSTAHYVDVRHAKTASTPTCSAFLSGYTIAAP